MGELFKTSKTSFALGLSFGSCRHHEIRSLISCGHSSGTLQGVTARLSFLEDQNAVRIKAILVRFSLTWPKMQGCLYAQVSQAEKVVVNVHNLC